MEKNEKETKLCKHCQSEIPKKAKVCPVCKRKQGIGGCLTVIIVVIVLFLIIAIVSGGEKDSDSSSTSSEGTEQSTQKTETQEESESQPSNRFSVGDVVETDDLRITFVSAEPYTSDNQFIQPKEGYEYWKFEFSFENISDGDQSVSSMLNWECYADNTMTDQTWIGDENGLDGTLSPGRKTQGAVYFEIPVDSQSIEIEYDINFWMEDKIVFVAK